MKARKIIFGTYTDPLVAKGAAGQEVSTVQVITAVLTSPASKGVSVKQMRDGSGILDALEAASFGMAPHVLISEEQWQYLKGQAEAFQYASGSRAMLSAVDSIIDAEDVDLEESEPKAAKRHKPVAV